MLFQRKFDFNMYLVNLILKFKQEKKKRKKRAYFTTDEKVNIIRM